MEREISRVVLGSMVFSPEKATSSYATLDAFFAAGGNVIDTAYVYAGGDCERLIRVSTIVDHLNQEIGSGRIRAIGASNWAHHRIQEANDYAIEHGLNGFVVSSSNLSLAIPQEPLWKGVLSVSEEARVWHVDRQVPLMPWSSQARAFFIGQFAPDNREDEDLVRVYYNDANFERLKRAEELGEKKGCSTIQIALGYVLHQPFPIFPIIGPAKPEELDSSHGALEIELSDDEMQWLNLEG